MGGLKPRAQLWWGFNLGIDDDFTQPWWMQDSVGGHEEWEERWCQIQGWPLEDYAVRSPLLAQVPCAFDWWGHLEHSHLRGSMAFVRESFREADLDGPLAVRQSTAPKSWWYSELSQFMELLELPAPDDDPGWFLTLMVV